MAVSLEELLDAPTTMSALAPRSTSTTPSRELLSPSTSFAIIGGFPSSLTAAPKKKPVSRSIKTGLQFSIGRIGRYLKKGHHSQRVGTSAQVYLAAVLE
ncbi:putative histone H2A.4 [Vitis vinifera]|uniref:Putative histone H2A.4 n=1 Tax=Vitis vinifera TaxID=29760 RepID=A0A438CB33_VITVI|nr:putative histone H2A.4 [Vitis vinifera]